MTRPTKVLLPLVASLSAAATGQIPAVSDGDYVVCENFTAGTAHGIYAVSRWSAAVTSLFGFNTGSATIGPNWVTMARDNRGILVATNASNGAMDGLAVLTPGGAVTSFATTWRTDNVRLEDRNRLIWNGIAGAASPPLTNAVMATDDGAGNPTILVSGLPATATVLSGALSRQSGLWAFSAQSTTPTGYLIEADLAAGAVTRTIATGFTLFNTVDYSRHDDSWYGTEFGLPGDPGAPGGSVYRITNAGVVTTLQTGLGIDRVNSVEVAQDNTLVIGSRHNILIMTLSGTLLRTLPFQSDRSHAATGVTVYGNNRLQLDTSGGTGPGSIVSLKVSIRNPMAAGAIYVLGPALYMWPGYGLPNGEILDLVPDALTLLTIAGFFNHMFQGFVGTLDANGEAAATVTVPATIAPNVSIRLFIAGVVLTPANQVIAVIETEAFTIRTPP